MIVLNLRTIITGGLSLCLAAALGAVVIGRTQEAPIARHRRAHELGAEFLGAEGVVLQDRATNCGPAALKMVLDQQGCTVSLQDLEEGSGGGRRAWSMLEMKNAAARFQIDAEGWDLTFSDLQKRRLPAILFLEEGHFVLVDSITGDYAVYLRDPAVGKIRMSRPALQRIWKGKSLLCGKSKQATFNIE